MDQAIEQSGGHPGVAEEYPGVLRRCPGWVLISDVQAADLSAGFRTPFPMPEVNGLAAKCFFHSRGVSCATSRAGWGAIRCSTSTSQMQGSTSCMRHVETRLWMIPTCSAPSSDQQNNQFRRLIGMARIPLQVIRIDRDIGIRQADIQRISPVARIVHGQ